jgi:uncharacterized protein YbaP (TraB family)
MTWLRALAVVFLTAAFLPAAAQQRDAPALWKVGGAKGKVYLFGSFHMLPPEVAWRSDAVDAALRQADVIVLETDVREVRDPAAMRPLIARYGVLPEGASLRASLPAATRRELDRVTRELGLPPEALERARPWLAAIVLTAAAMAKEGFDPKEGIEEQVTTWALAEDKALGALESNESQIRVMADLGAEAEAGLLAATLKQIRDLPATLGGMLKAYRTGDVRTLEKTVNAGLAEVPALRQRLLKDRHERWLPQIEKMMKEDRTYVVVVGAAHVVGPDSVVAMLRAKGIRVEGP